MPVHQDTIIRVMLGQRVQLVGYICAIVLDRHEAEDIFQDLSIEALRNADEIKDEGKLPGWLLTRARYRAIDRLRKHSSSPLIFSSELMDKLDVTWSESAIQPSRDTLDSLRLCVDTLTPKARMTLDLRYTEGLSGKEIGVRIGSKANAVYVALSRIHKALAACMARRVGALGADSAINPSERAI